jgi:hypothetical protein
LAAYHENTLILRNGRFPRSEGTSAEDLVFVLDVNENYRPWLIERERLFSAMDTFDGQQKRGLLLIGDD